MADKTYLVRLKPRSLALQHITALRFEIHDEHLMFVGSEGDLAALFPMELVQSGTCCRIAGPQSIRDGTRTG